MNVTGLWRKIYQGRDPIALYRQLMDALGGDPTPLFDRIDCPIPEVSAEGQRTLGERVGPTLGVSDPERATKLFFEFCEYLDGLAEEYLPFAEVAASLPGSIQITTYRDVVGFWLHRDLLRNQSLWSSHRAGYLLTHGLPLPEDVYKAIGRSQAEAEDLQYEEGTDQVDRTITGRAFRG